MEKRLFSTDGGTRIKDLDRTLFHWDLRNHTDRSYLFLIMTMCVHMKSAHSDKLHSRAKQVIRDGKRAMLERRK